MRWLANMQTGTKLTLSFGVMILILGFVIFQSLTTINKMSKMQQDLYSKQFRLVENVTKMDDDNNNIENILWIMIANNDPQERQKQLNLLQSTLIEQNEKEVEVQSFVENDPKFISYLETYKNLQNETTRLREEQIIPAINSNNFDLAKKLLYAAHNNQFQKMSDIVGALVHESRAKASLAIEAAKKEAHRATVNFITIGIVAIVLSIIIVLTLNRLISTPLNELSTFAKRVAGGELRISELASFGRKDEVGMLGDSFKVMVKNLNKLTSEISGVINFLSSSSSEIASASSQLSSTASETATSIGETTTTIEEVKQTSQVASKKATLVSENAKKTVDMSETGKKAADEINEVISEIHNQMGLIAETMMRLSEQSQAVGAIIATVEDLAQQTNLLAVNASIEASKAGEQGKGFSVVAQEVKSLATQSKQATSQVRTILSEIQKATSAAVMATEMGSKAVETGVKKTGEAGNTILTLVKTVSDNAQAASQIAAVSHQQLVGMEQATVAMENIKKASSQNVESSRMLKDSVGTIKELGDRLKQMIGHFKTDSDKSGDKSGG